MKIDRSPVLSDEDIEKRLGVGRNWHIDKEKKKEAQRDADAEYYESKLEQLVSTRPECDNRFPLLSRARAEFAVGDVDCGGRKYEPIEWEDLVRTLIFGAEIQRDKDYFDELPTRLEQARAEVLREVGEWLENNAYAKSSVESGNRIRQTIEALKEGKLGY